MILESLLLADNAAAAGGKLYVHGGGITRITPPTLPWVQPLLTVVLRLLADDVADLMAEHSVAMRWWTPPASP